MIKYNERESFGFTRIDTLHAQNLDVSSEEDFYQPEQDPKPFNLPPTLPIAPMIKPRPRQSRHAHRSFNCEEELAKASMTGRFNPQVTRQYETLQSLQSRSKDHNPMEDVGTERTKPPQRSRVNTFHLNQSVTSRESTSVNAHRFKQYIVDQRKTRAPSQAFKERLGEQRKLLNKSECLQAHTERTKMPIQEELGARKEIQTPTRKRNLALQTTGRESSDEKEVFMKRLLFKNLEVEGRHELAQQIIEIINDNERRLQASDAKLNVYLENSFASESPANCLHLLDGLQGDWKVRLLNIGRIMELINMRGSAMNPQNLLETVFKTPKSLSKTIDFALRAMNYDSTKATLKPN